MTPTRSHSPLSYYSVQRALMRPYVAVMRALVGRERNMATTVLEVFRYRPAAARFLYRAAKEPDLLHSAPIDETATVVDVGAFDGEWSSKVLQRYGARIFAFEPDPTSFERLERRFADEPRVRRFPHALTAENGEAELLRRVQGSTLFAENPEPLGPSLGQARVQTRDIVEVLEELQVERIDLLKLNVEGAEYEILDRLIDSGTIRRCGCLLIQFHEWRVGAHGWRRRIRRALARTHRPEWNYAFVWEKWLPKDDSRG